jgi:hypothetical protein
MTANTPEFFDAIAPITMYDPLSETLGATSDGLLTYRYFDMVKLAGHSCPTVAGAWIMTVLGLRELYGEETPVRGNIKVELHGATDEGVEGVVANCIGLVTGAAGETGFKGLGGKFARNDRLFFGVQMPCEVRLSRLDETKSVCMRYDPSSIPPHPDMRPLMQKLLQSSATPEERKRFAFLWQERVERILTSTSLWKSLVTMQHN